LPSKQAEQLALDAAAFEAEFANYRINLQHYSAPEKFLADVVSSQTKFDVVLASPELLGSLWLAGRIMPMSDLFPASFLDSFAAVTLPGATATDQLWGLPETAGFHLMLFYNKALVDTPPATVTEMEMLAGELATDDSPGLIMNTYEPLWLVPWLTASGGWLVDADGQPAIETAAMEQALALYASWFPGTAPIVSYDEALQKFMSGDAAMLISGDWTIAQLASARELDWGVAVLPDAGESPAVPLVLSSYWAVSGGTNQDRALAVAAFLEFLSRPERQLAWTTEFGTLPTRREALDDPVVVSDVVRRTSAAQMRAGRMLPLGVSPNLVLDAMRQPLQQVIDGTLTPVDGAAQIQTNLAP
jgi:maltose-binding protein MalE